MFQLFRKPAAGRDESTPPQEQQQLQSKNVLLATQKQEAMARALALAGDEAAAVEFILSMPFAEARLQAAEYVRSAAALDRVLQAMRNNDRRVAKLMQQRLDAIHLHERAAQQAQRCIAAAESLLADRGLNASPVALLDRDWEKISDKPLEAEQAFATLRAGLRSRLEAQAALQRAVLDVAAALRTFNEAEVHSLPAQAGDALARLKRELAEHLAAAEAASLPRGIADECARLANSVEARLEAAEEARRIHAVLLERLACWESADLASLNPAHLEREWSSLPVLYESGLADPLQARMAQLLQHVRRYQEEQQSTQRQAKTDCRQHAVQALEQLELAIQEGSLQLAAEHDKVLRAIDMAVAKLSEAQSARLGKARAELVRLQGWARWGGNVSREELLHAAEALPLQRLAIAELARKVGSLRERWKSLDASAGPAAKELWQRFDQACGAAYAPAAEHFKKQAEERKQHAEMAQQLIDELRCFAAAMRNGTASPEWKNIAAHLERSRQAWQRLGNIDRKQKKRLDGEFGSAWESLATPLSQERTLEAKRRESLIAEATALDARDRNTPQAIRALQERWQLQAKSLPLTRKDEQALWQRFRVACDKVFETRKEASHAADAQRHANLKEKESWCVRLEAAGELAEAQTRGLMREAADAWSRIGPVPRAAQDRLESRYRKVLTQLRVRLEASRRKVRESNASALIARFGHCRMLEQMLVDAAPDAPQAFEALAADWSRMPATDTELAALLEARFSAAADAMRRGNRDYAATIARNHDAVMQELLRLEIVLGLDSPLEFSQARLRLQVEVLQSALKSGRKSEMGLHGLAHLKGLMQMPASLDEAVAKRIARLIERCNQA